MSTLRWPLTLLRNKAHRSICWRSITRKAGLWMCYRQQLTKGVEPVAKKGLAVIVALFADGQAAWCGVDDAGKGGLGGLVASEYAVARLESTVNVPAWALPVKSSWNHHNGDPTPRESHYKSPVAIGHPQPVGEMGEVLFNIRNHVE